MQSIKIILFSIATACIYGIAHDLVTTHVCVEYFLPPAHPMIVPTTSPWVLALIWGVIATWWMGLLLGIPLAVICRVGRLPQLTVKEIFRPVLFLIVFVYTASMLFGCFGYYAQKMHWVWLLSPFAETVSPERHARFLFDLWAHGAAYAFGGSGGGAVCGVAFAKRLRIKRSAPPR